MFLYGGIMFLIFLKITPTVVACWLINFSRSLHRRALQWAFPPRGLGLNVQFVAEYPCPVRSVVSALYVCIPWTADNRGDYVSLFMLYTADIVNLAKLFIPNAKSFAIFCANSKADSCPYTYMSRSQKLLQSKMYASRVRAWDVREGVKESFFSYSPLKIIPNTSYLKPLMI